MINARSRMIKEFIFCVGLPGCGKSTYLDNHYPEDAYTLENVHMLDDREFEFARSHSDDNTYFRIAADDLKPYLDGYTDEHPEVVHEQSVKLVKSLIFKMMETNMYGTVILDGGGINRHYNASIIEHIRLVNPTCKITCLYFDTPIEVCLKRISLRKRKVPIESIYDKNQRLIGCINRYKEVVDEFIRIDYYTNKYVMLDMDGTIAGFSKVRFDEEGNADFVNGELFRHLRPNNFVINFIKEHYDMKNVYICTACANSIAWTEKCEWLDKYFPEIPKENRFWCGNKDYKYVFVKQFAEHMGWKRNEVVLIDDYHPTIDKCKKVSVNCLHPSNIEALIDPYAVFS